MVSLGEPATVGCYQQWHVGVGGGGIVEQILQVHLSRDRSQQVAAPHHLAYAHEGVVDYHGQLVGKDPISPADDEVAAVTSEVFGPVAIDEVVELDDTCWVSCSGNPKTGRGVFLGTASFHLVGRKVTAGALVDVGPVRQMRCGCRMEFRTRAEAREGEAACREPIDCRGIYVKAFALVIGALVLRQAQPFEIAH